MNASICANRRNHWVSLLTFLTVFPVLAFPPAPPHSVYGMVRDEQGNPLKGSNPMVVLEVDGRSVARTTVDSKLELGVNYRLSVPVDAGVTADKYKPTALLPTVPFRLKVRIGNVNYLPIEMTGASALIAKPSAVSRVDLTLGEDSDGDGIPDAWERNLIAAMGAGKTLADIRPEEDADKDGLSNLQEYLAGTYAFDPEDGFSLSIRAVNAGRSVLEFTAIRGRSYTVQASADLQTWKSTSFNLGTDTSSAAPREVYESTDVRPVRILTSAPLEDEVQPRFFKLVVH